jgi:hypothetical protein
VFCIAEAVAYYEKVNKKKIALLCMSFAVLLVMLFGFSPYSMPLFFVILPMIPMTIIVVLVTHLTLTALHVPEVTTRRLTIISGIVMGVLLVLMSLGQLTLKDFTILFLFGLIGTFYVSRMFSS